jgi:hypothetical protein
MGEEKPLKDRDELGFAIEDFDIQAGSLDVIYNPGDHFVSMAVIVAEAADPDGGDLPFIAIFNFGNGDMEFIADAGNNGLHHHPFTFEGFILWDTQVDFTDTDIHDLF